MLVSSTAAATQGISEQGGAQALNAGFKSGIEIAQQVENAQAQRAELERKKAEHETQKFTKVGEWFDTASKMPEGAAKKAFVKNYIPNGIKAFGLADKIDPIVLDMVTGDPNLAAYLTSEIYKGNTDMSVLTDPERVAAYAAKAKQFGDTKNFRDTVEANRKELTEAQKFATSEEGKSARTQAMAAAQAKRQENQQTFTAGQGIKQNAEAYGSKLVANNIPSVESKIEKFSQVAIPGGLDKYDGKTEIPGIGGADALLPIGQLSKVGARNRQLALALGNEAIKLATGAGMSNDEAKRILGSLGFDLAVGEGGGMSLIFRGTQDSSAFVNGVRNLRDTAKATKSALGAGAGMEAVNYYNTNLNALKGSNKSAKASTGEWQKTLEPLKGRVNSMSPEMKDKFIGNYAKKFAASIDEIKKALESK